MKNHIILFLITSLCLIFSLSSCLEKEKDTTEDDETKEYQEPIDEKTIITEVSISLDTNKYTATTKDSNYSLDVSTDKYMNFIYIKFTSIEGYRFSKSTIVNVNSKQINSNISFNEDYTIMTYKMADPNWTPAI